MDRRFRGYDPLKRQWVYGFHTKSSFGSGRLEDAILDMFGKPVKVLPESIGLDTGAKDKGNSPIFEGDLIPYMAVGKEQVQIYARVYYNPEASAFCLEWPENGEMNWCFLNPDGEKNTREWAEVAGNLTDTPELFKKVA